MLPSGSVGGGAAMALAFRRLLAPRLEFCFRNRQNSFQASGESVERAHRIIGGHIVCLSGFAGTLFQHVSGTAEPMSAL